MNTHESYVSLEVAKLLKEAGFDWECEYLYLSMENISTFESGKIIFAESNTNSNLKESEYSAPTLEVAQRWLREVKGVDVFAYRNEPKDKFESITSLDGEWETTGMCFETYESALEAGIKKCLELILNRE